MIDYYSIYSFLYEELEESILACMAAGVPASLIHYTAPKLVYDGNNLYHLEIRIFFEY